MKLYPHWLDGEYVRIATSTKHSIQNFMKLMKVHALIGTQFLLSDVQIFDSLGILSLFMDEYNQNKSKDSPLSFLYNDAEYFNEENGRFLNLKVTPDKELGSSNNYALAARGLKRTFNPGWVSSVFYNDPDPIKFLADEIINSIINYGYFDSNSDSKIYNSYPNQTDHLRAVKKSISYFSKLNEYPQNIITLSYPATNYYDVLNNLLKQEFLSDDDKENIYVALNFINNTIEDPEARKARSKVLSNLNNLNDRKKQERIWNNVVLAWNYAVQDSLLPDGASTGNLPGAVSPALFLQKQKDTIVPLNKKTKIGLNSLNPLPNIPLDIDQISWNDIHEIRKKNQRSIKDLSLARRTREINDVCECFRTHLKNISQEIYPIRPHRAEPIAIIMYNVVIALIANIEDKNNIEEFLTSFPLDKIYGLTRVSNVVRKRRSFTNTISKMPLFDT